MPESPPDYKVYRSRSGLRQRLPSRELSVAQNGLVRSYALALAGGLAVLAVVFLAVR